MSIFSTTNAQLLAAHFSWFSCMLNKHSIILPFHLTGFIFESHFKSHFKKDAEKNSKSVRNLSFLSINIKSLMCRQSTVNHLCYTKTKNWKKSIKALWDVPTLWKPAVSPLLWCALIEVKSLGHYSNPSSTQLTLHLHCGRALQRHFD